MDLKPFIRDIPDFPKPGIVFKDITTLVAEPKAFRYILESWQYRFTGIGLAAVVGIESRGFIFGAPLADRLGVPFIPIRKPGKLPYKTMREEYALEYGTDAVEIHTDSIRPGDLVIVVDDLLATGGTARAAAALVERQGGKVHELVFVIELDFLNARFTKLKDYQVSTLIHYAAE